MKFVPKRLVVNKSVWHQAITWTNDDPVYWCTTVLPTLTVLTEGLFEISFDHLYSNKHVVNIYNNWFFNDIIICCLYFIQLYFTIIFIQLYIYLLIIPCIRLIQPKQRTPRLHLYINYKLYQVNSLAHGKFEWNFVYVIFKWISVIVGWGMSFEIALLWLWLHFMNDQSTLVKLMAWCCQATSLYLNQCWPRSLMPNGFTRPQWVNLDHLSISRYYIFITLPHYHCFLLIWYN